MCVGVWVVCVPELRAIKIPAFPVRHRFPLTTLDFIGIFPPGIVLGTELAKRRVFLLSLRINCWRSTYNLDTCLAPGFGKTCTLGYLEVANSYSRTYHYPCGFLGGKHFFRGNMEMFLLLYAPRHFPTVVLNLILPLLSLLVVSLLVLVKVSGGRVLVN